MHMDPILPRLVGVLFVVLGLGLVLRRFRQPSVVVYLLAGVLLGPHVAGLIEDPALLRRLGEIGVLLLLFFVGLEIDVRGLLKGWRVPMIGTALQIGVSLGLTLAIGYWMSWPIGRSVLLGFVISLSSTAIVIRLLQERGEATTQVGRDVVGVLLIQDLAIIPMLLILGLFAGERPAPLLIVLQVLGGVAAITLLVLIARRGSLPIRLLERLRGDPEVEVPGALLLCFGLALLSALLGLSTAMGAFLAGILLAAAGHGDWAHRSLEPFRVTLLGVFFLSIGAMLDLSFVRQNALAVALLVAAAFITNTLINAGILRLLGRPWREAAYGAALLSQVGEFSFVLAAVGLQAAIISEVGYQFTVAVIAGTLGLSTLWIAGISRTLESATSLFDS